VDRRTPFQHPAGDARRLQDVERARVDGQCSGLLGGLVAHLDDSGNPPLPGQEQRGPKADRPGPDNYRLILVAHDTLQCPKALLDRSWPPEQADAHFEKEMTYTTVPVQASCKGDPLGAVASEMGAKRTSAGLNEGGAIFAPQSEFFCCGVDQGPTG
jgi:hypothetical protein